MCPATPAPSRTLGYTYDLGYLTVVQGWTNTIAYHPNGLLDALPHLNGVTDNVDLGADLIPRPKKLYTIGVQGGLNWDSGDYLYDGAGNIVEIGSGNDIVYDKVSRVVSHEVSSTQKQDYVYDQFGNLTQITTTVNGSPTTRSIAVVPSTNRLSVATYDLAGSMTSWAGRQRYYDPLNHLQHFEDASQEWFYAYTADEERLWALHWTGSSSTKKQTFSLRGLDGQLLREWELVGAAVSTNMTWEKDYIRGPGLLASEAPSPEGITHFHRDHLGTPRLLTDASGSQKTQHTYYAYGEEGTDYQADTEKLKFTGHERDVNGTGTFDDQDYMHARYYSPHLGRFLSPDPFRGRPTHPQSLNRYVYALDNPLKFSDPTGRFAVLGVVLSEQFLFCYSNPECITVTGKDPRHDNAVMPTRYNYDFVDVEASWEDSSLSFADLAAAAAEALLFLSGLSQENDTVADNEAAGETEDKWNWGELCGSTYQSPGCDGIIEEAEFLIDECCDMHDCLYGVFECDWTSWGETGRNLLRDPLGGPSGGCDAANRLALACAIDNIWWSGDGWTDTD